MARRKKAKTPATDRLTTLSLDLRARIASFLPYAEVARLSMLSRPWRLLHLHTPVVVLDLRRFLLYEETLVDKNHNLPVLLNDSALLAIRLALHRRARDGCKVDTLDLEYSIDDPRMKRHADRIVALCDARDITLYVHDRSGQRPSARASTLDLPPAARVLSLYWDEIPAPTIAGPGAASLRELDLQNVELREWPLLPSLRYLSMTTVFVKGGAPFAPAACYPKLEHLSMHNSFVDDSAHVGIRLPSLKTLAMVDLVVSPPRGHGVRLDGDITVDCPVLEKLAVKATREASDADDYKTFTVRAPRLRSLRWRRQFASRVDVDAGSQGSVESGKIVFKWNAWNAEHEQCTPREMKDYRALMMRMLLCLLPDVPPESVADIARPYMTLNKYTVEDDVTGDIIPEEKLACDLGALMASLQNDSP